MHDAVMMWAYAKKQSLDVGGPGTTLDAGRLSSIIQSTNFTGTVFKLLFGACRIMLMNIWIALVHN